MFKAKMTGMADLLKKIEKIDVALADGVDKQLTAGANNIAYQARIRAPKGRRMVLAGSIAAITNERFKKRVQVTASFAPFVEFGTGVRVFQTSEFNFTPEMKAYAHEFYVNGQGVEPARPFLFPSFELEKVAILKRIKDDLFND